MKEALYNKMLARHSLLLATRVNGTVNGASIDREQFKNFSRSASVLVVTGTVTDGSHAITLEESDNGSAWSTVGAADLLGAPPTIVATDDDKLFEFGYTGSKRFLRVVAVTTGATTGGVYTAVIFVGEPRRRPIARA